MPANMSSLLHVLTDAIVAGTVDVQTARSLIIAAHSQSPQAVEQEVPLYPTTTMAAKAKALGVSRATLYRMGVRSHAAKAGA